MQRKAFEYDKGVVTFHQNWWDQLETLLATLGLNGWEVFHIEINPPLESTAKTIRWIAKRPLSEEEAIVRKIRRGMA